MPKNIHQLHPIDSFGIQKVSMSGIRVEKLEDRIKPGVPFPHKHDFFQLMLITRGTGWHQIDFNKYKVQKGQLYLMKPGQMHSWQLNKGIEGFVVEFNYQSLNVIKDGTHLIKGITLSPDVFQTTSKDFKELMTLLEIMREESKNKKDMNDLSLQAFVTNFLISIIRLLETQVKQEKTISIIERFRELLEKNFKVAHGVDFYAHELKTSARALTMQLTRSINKPPRELIQDRILLEAKRFLAFSDLSVAEIGYELGFEDANYFTRFFRVHEKKTPAQFRKDNKAL